MYPQISVASLRSKVKGINIGQKYTFKNDFLKDHVLNSIFIPIQISCSSPTAILPEILIVTNRRDLRTFTEITEKNTKIITFELMTKKTNLQVS